VTPDLLFFYTGWIVWAILGVCVAVAMLVGLIVGIFTGYRGAREWAAGLMIAHLCGDAAGRAQLAKVLIQVGLPPECTRGRVFGRWLINFRTYARVYKLLPPRKP
jgi:hypothetical protein